MQKVQASAVTVKDTVSYESFFELLLKYIDIRMNERPRGMPRFKVVSEYEPQGDQIAAIESIVRKINDSVKHQILLGVTGSGKTFSMAKVIEGVNRPTLIVSHNKTLAAQLYREFESFFPENSVEYFVSYYDYYQPEAYVPTTDTYIEKDASINDEIDKMRHSATRALFERRDVVIVASVSCIYGLGSPEEYFGLMLQVEQGEKISRRSILRKLVEIQYERNDMDFRRGVFRVRGDVVEIFPSYEDRAVRIELFGDEVDRISVIDPLRGKTLERLEKLVLFPNSHYVTTQARMEHAMQSIREELAERLDDLVKQNRLLEAQRLEQRTNYDLEMMELIGYCSGIENYSRHLTGRKTGEPPPTLLDYMPEDALIFIDESHVTVPQLRGMYRGDRSRKETLVKHGFRLPSALDNRPLKFEEFEEHVDQALFVSATPGAYEYEKAGKHVSEQIIRPTGLLDPQIIVRPVEGQVDDLLAEIRKRAERNERVLVTTLTKKMAENLTEYYSDLDVKVRYLHSEIGILERTKIIRDLRLGEFDVLVGINLLREGLDLPEVTLVAILDADKEGFLRSSVSLIQTIGRCARNVHGQVILYADRMTDSIKFAVEETERRRKKQMEYNREHGITPESIKKSIHEVLKSVYEADYVTIPTGKEDLKVPETEEELEKTIKALEKEMRKHAKNLEFEKAAQIRDKITELKSQAVFL